MKNKFTISWYGTKNITGGSEIYWDMLSKDFGFKQINYHTAVTALDCIYPYEQLGFREVDGAAMIEKYVQEMEKYSEAKMFVKNSMQLPFYYPKAHTICLVQDAHKVAADALFKLGYYDKFSHNRVGKVFHHFQEESCKTSDVVMVPSEFMKDVLKRTFSEESHVKCPVVVPHGIDTDIFKPIIDKILLRQKYNIPKDKKVGIWVGRFHPQKGWHIMADLIWAMPEIHWIVVFMDTNDFETNRKNVTIFKNVPRSQMSEILNCADFYVMASLCESFCLSSLEATACGLPVVTYNTGWHWSDTGKWGEKVTDWKSSAFKQAVDKVLTGSYEPLETARNYSLENWKKLIKPVIE